MKIIQLSPHFAPNVGGVETHLDDLVKGLISRDHQVFVLTYQPLTYNTSASIWEESKSLSILRIPWVKGLFYRLVGYPILELLYLLPGLLFTLPIILLTNKIDIIHAHGLVAGVAGVFWAKLFNKRVVISLHNIYHFPKSGLFRDLSKLLLNNSNQVLTLSNQSAGELKKLGVKNVEVFTYWIDLDLFKPINKVGSRSFDVLFVGRLVAEKGIRELLSAASKWDQEIHLMIAGIGPLKTEVEEAVGESSNIKYLGSLKNNLLSKYYNKADVTIIPSTHEEGFGRVILESLACGTPVIGSNRGAIPEAMNDSVGILIDITPTNIVKVVEGLYQDSSKLKKLSQNARKYAADKYSEKNIDKIIESYNG